MHIHIAGAMTALSMNTIFYIINKKENLHTSVTSISHGNF